ncbi:MAG TPA: type II toxin-antitoxin system death-on-curing family toxin [Gemmatimonadales bacterium]|nr:type II toxin-antitoxin system death-on-curing family toxin [Gemmatimonadales bacterium]
MREPLWVPRLVVEAIHLDQLREHGGLPGLRDENLLEASLARPHHQWTYKRRPDLAGLAAAYAYGIVRNHPFRDGNKRVGFVTAVVFLGLNGQELVADDADVVHTVLRLADGKLSEAALARWIRTRLRPLSGNAG